MKADQTDKSTAALKAHEMAAQMDAQTAYKTADMTAHKTAA